MAISLGVYPIFRHTQLMDSEDSQHQHLGETLGLTLLHWDHKGTPPSGAESPSAVGQVKIWDFFLLIKSWFHSGSLMETQLMKFGKGNIRLPLTS